MGGWKLVLRGIHICLEQSSFRYSKNIELICFCLCKIYFVLILLALRPQCLKRTELAYAWYESITRCIHDRQAIHLLSDS